MNFLMMLWSARREETWLRRRARLRQRNIAAAIEDMPESEFIEHFRLDKATFHELCEDLRAATPLKSTVEITLETKVLCALSFFATGSYQRIVGVSQHLVQRTASRCIRQVIDALNCDAIVDKWIVFPVTPQQRANMRVEFQRKFQLPGVVGCIDCTHIAIVRPADNEHMFFNRKGYHSMNVQMICDINLRILNVNAKFGGAAHDSFIWTSSRAETFMRELHQNGEYVWLLGDSGYPQRPWLMTPVLNAAPGSREELYTQRHVQARNCIERCFGLLKARWRCLLKHRTLHYDHVTAGKITTACSVLHNIALDARLPPPRDVENYEDVDVGPPPLLGNHNDLTQGRAMLNNLITRM